MRTPLFCLFFFMMVGQSLWAEEPITIATDHFQQGLADLKQSVEHLNTSNQTLSSQNSQLKDVLAARRVKLGQLQHEYEILKPAQDKLVGSSVVLDKAIAVAQQNLFDVQNQIERYEAQLKVIRLAIGQKQDEERQIQEVVESFQSSDSVQGGESSEALRAQDRRKEKLKLMKMIYESKERQSELHASLAGYQKNAIQEAYTAAVQRRDALMSDMKALEAKLDVKSSVLPNAMRAQELDELEIQIKALEKNHNELEDLVNLMQKKSQSILLHNDIKKEQAKIQKAIEDLRRENLSLTSELEQMRSQMVELDKRKSRLESMLR